MLLYRVSSFTQTYLIVWQSMTTSWHAEMTMWHVLISAIMDEVHWHSRALSVTQHEIWQCHYMASWHDMAHMSGLGWDSWLDMPLRDDMAHKMSTFSWTLWLMTCHKILLSCHIMTWHVRTLMTSCVTHFDDDSHSSCVLCSVQTNSRWSCLATPVMCGPELTTLKPIISIALRTSQVGSENSALLARSSWTSGWSWTFSAKTRTSLWFRPWTVHQYLIAFSRTNT